MNILKKITMLHLICVCLMLCIVGGLWFPPLLLAGFAINCVACLLLKSEESYFLLMFLMPFGLIYKYPGVSTSFLTLVEIVVILLVFLRTKRIKMALFVSIALITVYFAFRMNTYMMAIPKLLVSYLLLAAFMKIYREKDAARYVNFFVVGLFLSSIVGMFKERIPQLLAYYDDLNYEYIEGEKTLRFSGLFDDPNYFSIALITAMVMLIFLKKYRKYPSALFYLFFIGMSALGIFTYSKSFILMFAAVLLLEVVLNLRGQHRVQSFIEIGVILLAVFVAFFGDLEIIQMIFSRFTNERGLTTGRDTIWKGYWEAITSREHYFWVGTGLDAPYVRKAAHSLYIEMIYYSGVIGLVAFLFGWLHLLFSSHQNRIRLRNMLLIVAVFVMYAFLSGFLNYAMPFYMVFCWMLMDMDLGKKKDELPLSAVV